MASASTDQIELSNKDPEFLRKLSQNGALLIVLDMPAGLEFGIDMHHWEIGEKFRGVKMIPPGVHFVYFSNVKDGTVAPRTGFFQAFRLKELIAFKWNPLEEILEKISTKPEIDRLESNRNEFDRFLGPYPYDTFRQWVSLSDKITEDLALQLQPEDFLICSVKQFIPQKYPPAQPCTSSFKLPDLQEVPRSRIRFSTFPDQRHPEGASAADVSRYGMDGSHVLRCLLKQLGKDGLLGELQFAFVIFLCGQVFDGFERWKRLVRTISTSESAMAEAPMAGFFLNFISILHFQLKEVPHDFFLDIVSRENFLTETLSLFFRNIKDSAAGDSVLSSRAERFRIHLTKTFKWDFDQEPEEDLPQVVDLDEG